MEGVGLIFAGEGDLVKKIKAFGLEMPDKIQYVGWIPYDKVLEMSYEADLLFSLRDANPPVQKYICGSKFLEAIMCGKPILVNKGTSTAIKVSKEKCGIDVRVGMRVEDYVAEEILAKFKAQRDLLSLAFGGEPQRVEFEYPCADGKICYLDTQWTPIRNKGEVIAIAEITRDITEQKQQAEEILIYNERLENFVKRAPIIIYFIKLDNPMPLDGNLSVDKQIDYLYKHAYIEDANDFWAKTIGYNQGKDLIGLRLNDFLPRENPESIQMLTKIIQYNYSNVSIESMETYPSGVTKFYINNINSVIENNKLIGIWGTSLNITELKIAEKKLIEAESKYRTVADFTFDWEYWINPKRSFEYISPSCKRITGYSPDEFFENPKLLDDIVYEEDKDLWIQHALNDVNQQGPEQIIFRIKRKDGAIRYIEHICQPVYDKDSIFVGIRASNRDITERRLAQQESQQLRSELIHASRVAAMGELTAAIAHELSQPLTAVMSNAQAAQRFLKMEKPDLAEVRDILTDIIGDDNRAKEIIQKLRSLLKKSERKFEKINIDEIIQDVMPLLHSDSVIKNVIVKTQFEKDLPHVFGDKIQLQQVLVNLILNGFEAMIDVDSKELCITTTQKDPDNIMVSIRDSGPGVKVQYIEDLFQPFFTTKANGMGMGLSICRSIIESHGGNVWAKNNPDQGATFYFTIPVFKGT